VPSRRLSVVRRRSKAFLDGLVVRSGGVIVGRSFGSRTRDREGRGKEEAVKGVHRIEVGDEAPDFTLPATGSTAGKGQKGGKITLSDYRGKKNVVLVFYPAAWTPV
jgi:hypothetical protein